LQTLSNRQRSAEVSEIPHFQQNEPRLRFFGTDTRGVETQKAKLPTAGKSMDARKTHIRSESVTTKQQSGQAEGQGTLWQA